MTTVLAAGAPKAEVPALAAKPGRTVTGVVAGGLTFAIAAVAVPVVLSSFWTGIATQVAIHACVLLSITVLSGFVGQVSLGQAAFMGVGAFASAALTNRVGFPVFAAVPLAGLCTIPFSLIIGLPALRLRGLTLAIVTLLFSTMMASFVFNNPDVIAKVSVQEETAADAITGIQLPQPVVDGRTMGNDAFYWVALAFLAVVVVLVRNVRNGRMGRLFLAVRESEDTVWAMGSSVVTVKLLGFAFSAFVAGVGGSLFAHYSGTASWIDFNTFVSILFFTLVAIAGLASIAGAVVAAVMLIVPLQLAIDLGIDGWFNQVYAVVTGVLLIATTIWLPGGLVSLPARVRRRSRRT